MAGLTLALFVFGYGVWARGRINRVEGALLLLAFGVYTLVLIQSVIAAR